MGRSPWALRVRNVSIVAMAARLLFIHHDFGNSDRTVKRIFLVLAVFSTLLTASAFGLGLNIQDARALDEASRSNVRWHMLTALATLCTASLVHAIWLTYFMGTGRWMEETCRAYGLSEDFQKENHSMKYGTMLAVFGVFLLLLLTGGLGAAVDPGSSVDFGGWGGLSGPTTHFFVASLTIGANLAVNLWEYSTIARNHALIERVMDDVRRIRSERGLPA